MAESPCPGSCSYVQPLDEAKGIVTLTAVAKSAAVQKIYSVLGAESSLHLVGGCVRDALLGAMSFDIDLASSFSPQILADKLNAAGIRVIETGMRHGTITALVENLAFEITTFRSPGSQNPAQNIQEDLRFRDFTINAIAFAISDLRLIDPLSGISDLGSGLLRSTGPANDRIGDDPLRMLRAVRFGPAAGRRIDQVLSDSIKQLHTKLESVSVERVREELKKILLCPYAADAIRALLSLDLLPHILPELLPTIGFEQNEFHIHDVFEHTLWVLERCPFEIDLRLAAIFHDIAKPQSFSVGPDGRRHFYRHEDLGTDVARTAMTRLKFSNEQIDAVCRLVRHHMRPLDCGPAGMRRLMRDLGPQFEAWKKFKCADATPVVSEKEFLASMQRFESLYASEIDRLKGSPVDALAIGGSDLIDLGLKPSPQFGIILKQLAELVIEDPTLNERSVLMNKAKELIKPGS
jgi:tRNA nucleotidyltransferase (CCA-adding enzyme)